MSGRDLRTFLLGHRAGTFNCARDRGLAQKYLTGGVASGGRGLKKVEYEQLLGQAESYRATAGIQDDKLKSLSKQGQDTKGAWLLRLHGEIWQQEWKRLVREVTRLESEMEEWRASNLATAVKEGQSLLKEVTEYWADLYQERRRFEEDTLITLRHLLVDIKGWIKSVRFTEESEEGSRVLQEHLALVKAHHCEVEADLKASYLELWRAVEGLFAAGSAETKPPLSVPDSVKVLHCPDSAFKNALMSKFDKMRDHYEEILTRLHQRHSNALRCAHGDWPVEDAERFGYILEQYPTSLKGHRRTAYLDRLAREFPQYSRQQLVAHETWHLSVLHHTRQRAGYLRDWHKHHRELEVKVQEALENYAQEVALKEAGQIAKEAQQALCKRLHDRVSQWWEERQQLLSAQAEQEAALQLEQQAIREREEEKRKKKQEKTRLRLQTYHKEQQVKKVKEGVWLEKLRAESESAKRAEAIRGQGRVKYRKEQLLNKLTQQKEVLKQKAKDEEAKEQRLAALRQQVQVNVTSDPERVYQGTVSVQARMHSDPELPTQHPLFTMYGYNTNKITSDPRFRLEEALRKAGLHESKYARQAMRRVKPPTVPRPDQKSFLFDQYN